MSKVFIRSHDEVYQQVCSTRLAMQLLEIGIAEVVTTSPFVVKFKGTNERGDPLPEVIYTKRPTPSSPLGAARKKIPVLGRAYL